MEYTLGTDVILNAVLRQARQARQAQQTQQIRRAGVALMILRLAC